ncbi:MAG: hypothetical protein A2651_02590 [Candidatus Yanofskybacteria bacterium RIFCSPHIGHO2_01_FULL_42_12]|uniref:Uncharacterized protein n=1 Tax=Candidatus Yanofskybacteria bacterium RIFCSPLOWO2_01_FULL_42_49 TaxID=1802694 RepID=A0A1F8GBL3_9BACT|nr:MAG: hypothetical protein A2651_02590 [Candidatus Yanofskybacteria bacterium RIFCSPHIGHO2_01_FULL_42_12]OGN22723.1 MAG: hypothetical protein A2918_01230 [Candidatus Yanofskybacteria bacterium RIFCSPLOWO2_01_FULL_42_49]
MRRRGLMSQFYSAVGSLTHWTIRGLLSVTFEKVGIEVHPDITRWIAFILTPIILIYFGIWSYFRIKLF